MTAELTRRTFAVNAAIALAAGVASSRSAFAVVPATSPEGDCVAGNPAPPPDLAAMLAVAGVPGIAQASLRAGGAATIDVMGKADAESGAPVTASTVFEAASLSKPTVAYVTLLLADRGLLDLDAPIREYLGASPTPDDPRGDRVTIRHALSHSSGLQNWRNRAEDKLRLAFDPGTGFQYSGEGFVLVQRILERRTNTAFAQLMREELFDPLGMQTSGFIWTPALAQLLSRPHGGRGVPQSSFSAGRGRSLSEYGAKLAPARAAESLTYAELEAAAPAMYPDTPALPNFLVPNAAASLLTTVGDYARFIAVLLDDTAVPTALRLRPATRQAMRSPQVQLAPRLAWGLGIGLEESPHGTLLWHWGDNGGYKNFVIVDPSRRRGRVIFTNGSGGLKVADRILRAEYGELTSFLWI